jgi:N4-gp56 family major capsid protein
VAANNTTTSLANLVAAGYDRELEWQLRSTPIYRQLVDKHPVSVTNPGTTVSLQIAQEFAAFAVTPLTEGTDVTPVGQPNANRVTVTINPYGNGTVTTLEVRELSFAAIDPMVAHAVGLNMVDTIDRLVRNQMDSATHIIGVNGGALKSDGGYVVNNVAPGDVMSGKVANLATSSLRARMVAGMDGDRYVGVIHPYVAADFRADSTTGYGWVFPHQYQDTMNLYNAEVGTFAGIRWIESARTKSALNANATPQNVYTGYVVGHQALVEAVALEPHTVIGPQVDVLRRNFPLGWYALLGESVYRQEAIELLACTTTFNLAQTDARWN